MANKDKNREYLHKALQKVKLHNAGEKLNRKTGMPVMESKAPAMSYPNLYLNIKQVPELKGKDTGDKCKFVVEGEIVSHSANSHRGGSERETFDIEVQKIGIIK